MNLNLFKTLHDRKILTPTTVLESYYPAKLLGGINTHKLVDNFNFVDFNNNKVTMKRVNTNEFYIISVDDVLAIDGMDPSRLAGIYGIKSDGSKKNEKIDPITGLPVRRGRKTNKVKELINDRLNKLGTRVSTESNGRKTKKREQTAQRTT